MRNKKNIIEASFKKKGTTFTFRASFMPSMMESKMVVRSDSNECQ